MFKTMVSSFLLAWGRERASTLRSSSLKTGFEAGLSSRKALAAPWASSSGVRAVRALMAVEYSLSVAAISDLVRAMAMGFTTGITASAMARSVFHWADVRGSSEGMRGRVATFGETVSAGSGWDILEGGYDGIC